MGAKANKLNFGGIVGYLDSPDKPPMGSGHYPIEGTRKSCFFSNVKYVDNENIIHDLDSENVFPFSSLKECYYVGPYSKMGSQLGNMFFFGGPGYC